MKICSIEGCGKKHWAKGFCYNHYRKDWYDNHPITKSCSIEGCEKKHWGRGLCKSHFSKYWYKNHPNYKKERYRKNREKCLATEYAWRARNIEHFKKYQRDFFKKYYHIHKKEMIANSTLWIKNHRDEINKRKRERYALNPEKYLKYIREYAWWKKNPEKVRESARKTREKYKEKIKERRKEWYQKNKERFRQMTKEWVKRNPEKKRENNRRLRIKRKGVIGSHTAEQWIEIKKVANGICKGWEIEPHYVGEESLTLDHIIPISRGGTDNPDNLQPLCLKCNMRKGNKKLTHL